MKKIYITNEILASMLTNDTKDFSELQADPKAYILANYNVDVNARDVKIVENTDKQVHLPLPYYSCIIEATAQQCDDAQMADSEIAGGIEAVFTLAAIFVVSGILGTLGAASATAGGILAAKANSKKKKKEGENSGEDIIEEQSGGK